MPAYIKKHLLPIDLMLGGLLVLNWADLFLTLLGIHFAIFYEMNPLLSLTISHSPYAFALVKMSLCLFALVLFRVTSMYNKYVRYLITPALGLYLLIVLRSVALLAR